MTVYFVRDGLNGAVKIGHTRSFKKRLYQVSRMCSSEAIVLRTIPGHKHTEKWIYQRFLKSHIQGEWFSFDPDMLTVYPPKLECYRQDKVTHTFSVLIPELDYQKLRKIAFLDQISVQEAGRRVIEAGLEVA